MAHTDANSTLPLQWKKPCKISECLMTFFQNTRYAIAENTASLASCKAYNVWKNPDQNILQEFTLQRLTANKWQIVVREA